MSREAEKVVRTVIHDRFPKVQRPRWVALPQLAGLRPLDQRLVSALAQDRPLRVLELFAGVGTGTQALARLGYHVGEVVACEARGAARVVHAHQLAQLTDEFPATVAKRTGAQLHHRLPQDIRLVSAQHLSELGPIDLVVAGWPCQGSSAAGAGLGLDDARSRLFTELIRVLHELQVLHKAWGQPLGYLIEHVFAGGDKRPRVQSHFEGVRGILGPELVLDAAQLGSRAHRLRAWWTNLEGMALLRAALKAQTRPPNHFVHQVLGPGRRARMPKSPGVLPWAKVEIPGEPRPALNTFVSYGGSYAFSQGGGGVLACVQPNGAVTYEEPTAEERDLAMGFPRGFTAARGVSEPTRRELLGQAMDLNSVMWILAVAREAGQRRAPLGGEAVGAARAAVGHGAGLQQRARLEGAATDVGAAGPQHRARFKRAATGRAEAGGVGPAATGQGAGGARGGGRVSPSPQPVGGRAEARDRPAATGQGAGGARDGGRVSPSPQPVGRLAEAGGAGQNDGPILQEQVQVAGANLRAPATPKPGSEGAGPQGVGASRAPVDQGASAGDKGEAKSQPQGAVTVGGGPHGEGWKVGSQLTKEEGSHVAAMVERNRDVFAFGLEEIGEFMLFEVELKLKSEQPIFERRRRHSIREWELVDERCRELEAAGIIEECDNDFAANSVMAAKKDPEGN
jgi:hypothetical protein